MIIIFAGPTINKQQISNILEDTLILPPVSVGDVYKAAKKAPRAIGIIDGYFDSVPSVWHKEILWAIDAGIPVFGASSMGALRAAELCDFGMIGIGKIFEAFRDGILEDDDEVALQHGPEELNFAPLSEPMVNIRATMQAAANAAIIDEYFAAILIDLAKSRFYPERTWENLLGDASNQDHVATQMEPFSTWLEHGKIDQKHLDAIAMLSAIKEFSAQANSQTDSSFEFQHTVMWDQLLKEYNDPDEKTAQSIALDCLRCIPERFHHYRARAAKHVAKNYAQETEIHEISPGEITRALTNFRAQKRLYSAASLNNWLSNNDMDMNALEEQVTEDILAENLMRKHPVKLKTAILDELAQDGCDTAFLDKAHDILEIVDRKGFQNASIEELGLNHIQLQLWYFENLLGTPMPDDIEHYISTNGFSDRQEFETMMVYQFVYWSEQQDQ